MKIEEIYADQSAGMATYIIKPDPEENWYVIPGSNDNGDKIRLVVSARVLDFYELTGDIEENDPDRFDVVLEVIPDKEYFNEDYQANIMGSCGLDTWDEVTYDDIVSYGATVARIGEYLFSSWDNAIDFIENIPQNKDLSLGGLMFLSGFLLDRPINRIGTDGWELIQEMV